MAIIQMSMRSDALKRDVRVNIILPFDKGGRAPYQTLYLLHGLKGGDLTWIENTRIVRGATDRNLAVVMPAGENSFYVNDFEQGSVHGDYEAFISEELIEKMRAAFPLSGKREENYIGGFSMGGYGALRNGLKYHDKFGKIAVFAGAIHFFESEPAYVMSEGNTEGESFIFSPLEEKRATDLNPRWIMEQLAAGAANQGVSIRDVFPQIKFFVGEDDTSLCEPNVKFAKSLQELGVDIEWDVTPGGHTWDFVDENLPTMLDWLVQDAADFSSVGEID